MRIRYADVKSPRIRVTLGAYDPCLILPEYMEAMSLESIDLLFNGWTEEYKKKGPLPLRKQLGE